MVFQSVDDAGKQRNDLAQRFSYYRIFVNMDVDKTPTINYKFHLFGRFIHIPS